MIRRQIVKNYNSFIKNIYKNNRIYIVSQTFNYTIANSNNNSNNNNIIRVNNYSTSTSSQSSYDEKQEKHKEKQKQINKNNKIALKKFFLKVHPDLFFQFPNIKKINDKSLRELHGFLEEIKTERLSRKSYNMQFYYLDDNIYDQEIDIPSINIKFSINISSNNNNNSFDNMSYHLEDAQEQIQYCLKSVGIKEEFILNSMIGNKSSTNNMGNDTNLNNDSLLHFVKNLSNFARETSRVFIEQEREVDLMYTYFYMEHKIRVLFSDHELSLEERKKLLKKLERLLNRLSPRLHESSNDKLVDQIFDTQGNNETKRKKRNKKLESFDLNDEEIDLQGDKYQGFGQRIRNTQEKEQIFEPFGMFSGKNKEQFSGWQHIKSGYITPESRLKTDESSLSDRLEGVSVVFSPKLPNGVDLEGRLILNQSSTVASWTKTLKSFKPSEIIQNIQACKNRQSIERLLAKYFKIGFVFTDYEKQNEKHYLELLNRLVSVGNFKHQQNTEKLYQQDLNDQELILLKQQEGKQEGFTKDQFINNGDPADEIKGLEEISIKIIMNNSSSGSDGKPKTEPWKFDSNLGVINVPLNVEYDEIIEYLKSNQSLIRKEHERHKINQRNIAQLELTFKRQFRLLRLKKLDDTISLNEMVSCLRRLLFNHQPFLPYLYGMKLIVGRENKIKFDGSIIIKWDFEL